MSNRGDILKTPVPIWNAGMGGGIAGPLMAAAVSQAGGMGVVGVGGMPAEIIAAVITATRQLTARPFGANVIMPMMQGGEIEACLAAKVPVLVLFWGDPRPYIAAAHDAGSKVVLQCGNAEEAARAVAAGVDAVMVQGTEAGGHVKAENPLAEVLAETLARVGDTPVIAAGGIATGADIARALNAGASAVSLGTRFVCTSEAQVVPGYQDRVLQARAGDTALTKLFDVGWPDARHRVVRNAAYDRWQAAGRPPSGQRPGEGETVGTLPLGPDTLPLPRYTVMPAVTGFEGDLEEMPLYCGESCDRIEEVWTVAEVMARLISELEAARR